MKTRQRYPFCQGHAEMFLPVAFFLPCAFQGHRDKDFAFLRPPLPALHQQLQFPVANGTWVSTAAHTPLGGKLVGGDWQVGQGWCLQHILNVTHTLEQQPNSFCCWISTVSCSIPWEVFFFSFFSFLYPPCCFS